MSPAAASKPDLEDRETPRLVYSVNVILAQCSCNSIKESSHQLVSKLPYFFIQK